MKASEYINDVHKLNGRVKLWGSSYHVPPKDVSHLFKALKGKINFIYKEECVEAFENLKVIIFSPFA